MMYETLFMPAPLAVQVNWPTSRNGGRIQFCINEIKSGALIFE